MAKKRSKKRWKLTDEQWAKIEPLLPRLAVSKRGGRPWADSRKVFEGILWILRTGAPWEDMPKKYASGSTCWRRLRDWEEQDVWLDIWRAFLPSWTNMASWIGANASSTAVLPRRKKGRMRGKNQERQGNEVDGGGRRPRCSSGKPPGLGVPVGNPARRENASDDSGSASGTGSPQTQAQATGCRSGIRWRSLAKVVGPTGHRTDLSTPQESTEKADAGWPAVAEVQATLESRTDLCLVRQQSPTGRAIRSKHPDLSCVLPCRLSNFNPQKVMKWLLTSQKPQVLAASR